MPAKRKTTAKTQAALRRLFDSRAEWEHLERESWPLLGMERTPGYTVHRQLPKSLGRKRGRDLEIVNPEPVVWVLRRQVRDQGTLQMHATDPLVVALWDTLPPPERQRSRLFVHCGECPVRFSKKGAVADASRCGALGRYSSPTERERAAADVRAAIDPPVLRDPRDAHECAVAQVWEGLSPLHRRTLYATMRPTRELAGVRRGIDPALVAFYELGPDREWALEGAPSPEAFISRQRTAKRALARALAARFFPGMDYSIKTRGRRGFDYERFWRDWEAHLSVG